MSATDTACIEYRQYPSYRDSLYRCDMDIKDERARRLREARAKAGYDSASAAAARFNWGVAGYRHHENGTRPFGLDKAKEYGRAFKVKPGWLLTIEGVGNEPLPEQGASTELTVNGSVEAGAWRESTEWNDDRTFTITDLPSPVRGLRRFGLEVVGNSMDEFYEPGTVLDCVSIFTNGVEPESGDHVIAEQTNADGQRELTVKEYLFENGRHFLLPRSTRPEFQQRIEVGAPSEDHWGDDRTSVIAFVVADYPPRVLRLFRRMEKIRR